MEQELQRLIAEYRQSMSQPYYSCGYGSEYDDGYESGRDSALERVIDDIEALLDKK